MSASSGPPWRDPRGCLTPAGFAALEGAPPGAAPAELAGHVAGCERCQQRWLAAAAPGRASRTAPPRSPWRNLGYLAAALLLLMISLFGLLLLRG